ncbi:hypothetical protein [Tsukamurella paurometabola]|uniref:Uncharacterized protein n=1 Tax=Tsukamurella paurometabola TaxID=2061 RepID=A0ABS5NH77_TSUPA|nr:hypothetical protein [Tsukamurella paurometabola]MBS4103278.1 hypothetical protein [Tsukamurella paurometabola]
MNATVVSENIGMYPGDPTLYALDTPYEGAAHVVVTRICTPCTGEDCVLRALLVLTDEYGVMLDQSRGFLPHWQSEGAATHADALAALGYQIV